MHQRPTCMRRTKSGHGTTTVTAEGSENPHRCWSFDCLDERVIGHEGCNVKLYPLHDCQECHPVSFAIETTVCLNEGQLLNSSVADIGIRGFASG